MNDLEYVVNKITEEFKKKSYYELNKIAETVYCFEERYNNKSYIFEVHVLKFNNDDKLKIMVEGARNKFFLKIFGKQQYFMINRLDEIKEINGEEFWGV